MSRILVVEDSPTQAAEIALVLEEGGFEVEIARKGEDALKLLEGSPFDLVLADVIMPGMSGFELCRRIKAEGATKDVPVFLLTTLNDRADILRGLESGADSYFNKPFDPEALIEGIKSFLAARAEAQAGKPVRGVFMGRRFVAPSDSAQVAQYLLSVLHHFARREEEAKEQRRAEEALRRSEERFALAVAGANDGLWDWDLQNNHIYFSPRANEILGYGTELSSVEPSEWLKRIHPDDRRRYIAELQAHIDGSIAHFQNESRVQRKDGNYIWLLSRGRAIRDANGKAYRMAGSATDIQEQKEMQAKLLAATEELRVIFKASPDLFVRLDRNAVVIDVHARHAMLQSLDPASYLSKPINEVLLGEVGRLWLDAVRRVQQSHSMVEFEYQTNTLEGERAYEARCVPLPEGEVLAIVRDITQRKRMEDALRDSEERWRSLVENAPDRIITVDRDGKILYFNRAAPDVPGQNLLGQSVYDLAPSRHRDLLRRAIESVFERGEQLSFEGRAGDGAESPWYLTRFTPVKVGEHVVAVTIISTDITERKHTERKLRESEARLMAIFRAVPVAVAVTDLDGHVLEVNRAAEEMLGYTAEELRAIDPILLVHPEDFSIDAEEFRQLVSGEREQYQITRRYKRRNGEIVRGRFTASLTRDEQGKPEFVVCVVEEIE